MSSVVTGEAVALDVRTAALGSRVLAALVDGVLQLALLTGLVLLVGLLAGGGSEGAVAASGLVSYALVGLGYPVLFETLMRGRTPGKALLGLRVVRDDAGPTTFRHTFVRGLIGFLIERPGITFYAAGVICSLADSRGRRLGDLAAGTMVVQERVVSPTHEVAQMPPPLAGWAATLELSALPDELALSVRSFLARADALTEAARADLGGRLASAVSAVVSPPPPPGTPGWAYLSAVLAERRRRETEAGPRYGPPAGPPPVMSPSTSSPEAPRPSAEAPAPAGRPPCDGFAPPF